MSDPRERFIEDQIDQLRWKHEPDTPEERRRAQELFRWISRH